MSNFTGNTGFHVLMSLQAYLNKAAGSYPLCGYVEEEDLFDKEERLIQ
jgi:hypothetical protein